MPPGEPMDRRERNVPVAHDRRRANDMEPEPTLDMVRYELRHHRHPVSAFVRFALIVAAAGTVIAVGLLGASVYLTRAYVADEFMRYEAELDRRTEARNAQQADITNAVCALLRDDLPESTNNLRLSVQMGCR